MFLFVLVIFLVILSPGKICRCLYFYGDFKYLIYKIEIMYCHCCYYVFRHVSVCLLFLLFSVAEANLRIDAASCYSALDVEQGLCKGWVSVSPFV